MHANDNYASAYDYIANIAEKVSAIRREPIDCPTLMSGRCPLLLEALNRTILMDVISDQNSLNQ
jgi:hypothetical protein